MAEQNPQFLLRLARKELNVPKLKCITELTVLIYILWLKGTLEDLKTYLNTDILPDEPKMSPNGFSCQSSTAMMWRKLAFVLPVKNTSSKVYRLLIN